MVRKGAERSTMAKYTQNQPKCVLVLNRGMHESGRWDFPAGANSDQLEWDALKGISHQKVMELATCEFLTKAHDCIIAGPVCTVRTHVEAARRRLQVAFYRAADLVRTLTEARDERMLTLLSAGVGPRVVDREPRRVQAARRARTAEMAPW